MPILMVDLLEGREPAQLDALIAGLTAAAVEALAVPPASVRVILHEVPASHWGVGGRSRSAQRKQGSSS